MNRSTPSGEVRDWDELPADLTTDLPCTLRPYEPWRNRGRTYGLLALAYAAFTVLTASHGGWVTYPVLVLAGLGVSIHGLSRYTAWWTLDRDALRGSDLVGSRVLPWNAVNAVRVANGRVDLITGPKTLLRLGPFADPKSPQAQERAEFVGAAVSRLREDSLTAGEEQGEVQNTLSFNKALGVAYLFVYVAALWWRFHVG